MEATSDDEALFPNRPAEENIWQLCKNVKENRPDEIKNCFCVFISNAERKIPLWHQQISKNPEGLVVWDYHVIFLHKNDNGSWVYDLDTSLDFPCEFDQYALHGIRSCQNLRECFRRRFRVINAEEFLSTFASDRSHMLNEKGEWLKPPPLYPCIKTQDAVNNIDDFISMDSAKGVGTVITFPELYSRIVADTLIYGTPQANRVDPDETAPIGAVSSGSTLFANMSNHVTMR